MGITRRAGICLQWLALTGAGHFFEAGVWAQNYPIKVVRYIVPMSPGAGSDTIGRIMAAGMAEVFGQQVIVDNRTGAGGNIGAEIAAKAPPDSYTLFQASMPQAINVSMYRNLAYDLVRDFAPVTQMASGPQLLLVHPSLQVGLRLNSWP